MGKEKNEDDRPQPKPEQQNIQAAIEPKKKIIRKVPFKTNSQPGKQDSVKDWKPTKIEKKNANQPIKKVSEQSLAQSFLGSLSKPVNKATNKSAFFDDDEPIKLTPKPVINMKKLTPQQIKWDIEDQTFIQKQFIPNKKVQHNLEEQPEEELGQLEGKELLGRNAKTDTKVKHVDISKIVNENWQEAAQRKVARNELWEGAQGLLDGRGGLTKLAQHAQERAAQIESQFNKRSYQKKQMKNRYGW